MMPRIAAFSRNYSACLLFAVLAILFMLPAAFAQPMSHDSFWIDVSWSEQFTTLLRAGNPYPRWLPWSYGGLGAPVFYYYAPLSFYLAGLFGLAGLSTYSALLMAFGTAWFASGVTMHAWLKNRAPCPAIGALVYMVLPYHVIDFYARGALAEFCAFAIVPLVAIGVRCAVERKRAGTLAVAYAALIMTHLPTAVIASVLLIAPYALWSARSNPKLLWPVARGVAGGLGGAAIYLVPALTLQDYTSIATLWEVRFLQPANWSLLHPELWVSMSYVFLFAGLALIGVLAAVLLSGRRWGFWTWWTIAIGVIVAGLLPGFWSLPVIKAVQFPWRALLLVEFGLATISASWRGSPVVATIVLLPLVLMSLLMASPANPMHGEPMQPLPFPGIQDVIEYLPPGAVAPGRAPRTGLLIQAASAARAHPESSFPFPSIAARCAGGAAPLERSPESSLVVMAPEGCRIMVKRLPAEQVGLLISLLAAIGLVWPWLARLLAGSSLARRRHPQVARS